MASSSMTSSVGIDIEDIGRFSHKPYLEHTSFYTKIFSQREIDYCLSKQNPYPHFAVRFCAKEAFIKAIGTKLSNSPKIEVVLEDEKPFVLYAGIRYTASLSHDSDKAVAIVFL